jgi:hypothetical protein
MDIPNNRDGRRDMHHVALFHKQFLSLCAYCLNDRFCQQFLLVQSFDAFVQVNACWSHDVSVFHLQEQTGRYTRKARHSAASFREADERCSCDQFENDKGRLKLYGGCLVLACCRQLARHASKDCTCHYLRRDKGQSIGRQAITASARSTTNVKASDFLQPSENSIARPLASCPECLCSLIISATLPVSSLYHSPRSYLSTRASCSWTFLTSVLPGGE